jgi:integrase
MPKTLTDVMLRKAKAPPGAGRAELLDGKVTGLIFRVTGAGVKTWSVLYRFHGTRRRLTLGAYRPEGSAVAGLTLAEARKKAGATLTDIRNGRDPQGEKQKARAEAGRVGVTLTNLAERWLASPAAAAWRPKTRAEFGRIVRRELLPVLGDLPPGEVTKGNIRDVYDRIAARSVAVAQHSLAVLRLLFSWAAEEDHVDRMPLFPKRGTQSEKRTRVLEEAELRAVWGALDAGIGTNPEDGRVEAMAEAFRLMLLTAQRRGEVLSMRWADVTEETDGAWWTIPAERHKSGREQRVPLTSPAVESLKRLHAITGSGAWVFPSPRPMAKAPFVGNPQKAATRLWEAVGLKVRARVHDLRRTAATYMVRMGVPRLVVGKVLGHADADVTGRYDKHAYDREKRGALERWASELVRIVAAKDEAVPSKARVLPWAR